MKVVSGTATITPGPTVGCTDTTETATGATTSMIVKVSPSSLPAGNANTTWAGYVSASGTVDIHTGSILVSMPHERRKTRTEEPMKTITVTVTQSDIDSGDSVEPFMFNLTLP